MITSPVELLGEARHLAVKLVATKSNGSICTRCCWPRKWASPCARDQIGPRGVALTEWIKGARTRDMLKHVVDRVADRILANPFALKCLNVEEVPAACELLTQSIKGLIVADNPANSWVLQRRLIIMFHTIESPWIEDPKPLPTSSRPLVDTSGK
jgi:hypothetical protein